jgi:hypothetical protein
VSEEMLTGFDFFDFGCSDGANIDLIRSCDPDVRGLGIDIDQRKINKAREKGLNAINFDILTLPQEKVVRFVTMSHFLEHLPSGRDAEAMIRRGIDVSREFVLIRQPWFDSDGYLLTLDLKLYWSDWKGHPNRMTSLDFYLILRRAFEEGAICGFAIFGRSPVRSSSDACLIPLGAPIDQHHYERERHGHKQEAASFDVSIYREIVVIAMIDGAADISRFTSPFRGMQLLKSMGNFPAVAGGGVV